LIGLQPIMIEYILVYKDIQLLRKYTYQYFYLWIYLKFNVQFYDKVSDIHYVISQLLTEYYSYFTLGKLNQNLPSNLLLQFILMHFIIFVCKSFMLSNYCENRK
jgi:hypothetical protein